MIRSITKLFAGTTGKPNSRNRSSRQALLTLEALESRENPSTLLPGPVSHFQAAAHVLPSLPMATPSTPSFSARAISNTQVSLSWNRVSGANGYVVDQWINGAWKQIGSFGSGSSSCTVKGLRAGTTYYFDVGAHNTSGVTWASYQAVSTRTVSQTFDHPAAGAAYRPVSGSLFGSGGPSYRDVQQGAVGDCSLLSSLAEVAVRTPSVIQSMFSYQGTAYEDGATVNVYTVRLYDTNGYARYITVDTELPAGGSYYERSDNGVFWVGLAEKAYAQANGMGYVRTRFPRSDSYSALNGLDPAWTLQAITGRSTRDFSINPTNLAAAWNSGKLIVLASSSNPANTYIVGGSDGTHAYAVVSYTASSSTPFGVYNPWGSDSAGWAPANYHGHRVYGLFWANSTFISQNFSMQSITNSAPGQMHATIAVVNWTSATVNGNAATGTATAMGVGNAKKETAGAGVETTTKSGSREDSTSMVKAMNSAASHVGFDIDLIALALTPIRRR